jgi:DNA phosphorothioation-dependent restriction protein DptG
MTGTWMATENSYADIQAGAGKYNNGGGKGLEKYAKAGYLFSLLDISESLSDTAAKYNALVNYVIWDIMGSIPELKDKDEKKLAKGLRREADANKNFDWSTTMQVYTANDSSTREFFAVLPPIATPIPSALFLFGSMVLGLFGLVTRRQPASN